jgi:hypothetical protein
MKMRSTIAALALAFSASLFGSAVMAAPVSPTQGFGVTQKLTSPVHYRGYRHCHRRYGHRRCHGGYAYYGYGPSIVLGFGGRRHHRHHYRGFRHGGGHMMRGPGRMHHGRRH